MLLEGMLVCQYAQHFIAILRRCPASPFAKSYIKRLPATSLFRGGGRRVRLAEWVPPVPSGRCEVGGALSRYTSTWEVHATGVQRRVAVAVTGDRPSSEQRAASSGSGSGSGSG
jgi:hypothetical protein